MTCNIRNLTVLAYTDELTLWHYRTNALPHSARARGYFDTAANQLQVGDIIHITGSTGAADAAVARVRKLEPEVEIAFMEEVT